METVAPTRECLPLLWLHPRRDPVLLEGRRLHWTKPHRPCFLEDGTLDPDVEEKILSQYNMVEEETGRRFQATSLLNPNPDRPNLTYEFNGHMRVWRWTQERMEHAVKEGRIYFPRGGKGVPREKRYLDEQEGFPLQDIWTDVKPISAQAAERLGYPTQKPEALLDRIIKASSEPGGNGAGPVLRLRHDGSLGPPARTAVDRDRHHPPGHQPHPPRLRDTYGDEIEDEYAVVGEPTEESTAGCSSTTREPRVTPRR